MAREKQLPLWRVERDLFGASHAEIGAALLNLWGLPAEILEAIALHHNPVRLLHSDFCALTAVHAADVLAHETHPQEQPLAAPILDADYLGALGLAAQAEQWRKSCVGLFQNS